MRGAYDIQVGAARVQFKFTLTRNITIIKGKSATGKTTLIDLIAEYEADGPDSGVSLSSPKPCMVVSGRDWKAKLDMTHDSFVFIDEGNAFIASKEFASAVKESDNYYVIATREPLSCLPYSVEEIYEIVNMTSRYPGVRKFYSQTKRVYGKLPAVLNPTTVIVEDSNSGFEFYQALCHKSGIECVSANGKANVFASLRECKGERPLVVADGAAFGPEMELVYELAERKGAGLFLPESFEWLVLASGVVKDSEIPEILAHPADFIESRDNFSWEAFFTKELVRRTAESRYLRYSKEKLNPGYLNDREFNAIAKQVESLGIVPPGL